MTPEPTSLVLLTEGLEKHDRLLANELGFWTDDEVGDVTLATVRFQKKCILLYTEKQVSVQYPIVYTTI